MNTKKIKITQIILIVLAFSALTAIAITAPNALQLLKYFQKKDKKFKKFKSNSFRSSLYRLKQDKLIKFQKQKGEYRISITNKGKNRALQYKLENLKIKKPAQWDKKWRLVIFDIPVTKKLARDILRQKLKQLGFYQLQQSVWVFPYECQPEINLIREYYQVQPYVAMILAEKIENQSKLLKFFNLKTAN